MEFKDLIKLVTENKLKLGISALLGLVLGTIVYFLPHKYILAGSFFVNTPNTESTRVYYAYDGYYAQQTANNLTQSFAAVLESSDTIYSVLKAQGKEINANNIRKIKSAIDVRKTGPAVVTVTVKHQDPDTAKDIWNQSTNYALETMGNNSEQITHLTTDLQPYSNTTPLAITALVGLLITPTLYLGILSFRKYLK